jgi:hypothetical protein
MDEDPSNEAFVLSLLEGYDADEVEPMDMEPAPRAEDWRDKYIALMDRGELPSDRSEARRRQDGQIIHPRGRRAIQARRVRRPAVMRAHPPGARAPPGHPRWRVQPPRGIAHPRGQHILPGLLLAYCGC